MAYNKENTGALFKNNKKRQGVSDPDMTGKINVDGGDYYLSAWTKTSDSVGKYLSISIKPVSQQHNQGEPAQKKEPWEPDNNQEQLPY